MAPGNKPKTFTSSYVSKSRPGSQRSTSATKKRKRTKKSAKGGPLPEPVRCYSPLVYDPEVCRKELMQKYARPPEALSISDLQQYEADGQTSQKAAIRIRVSHHISRFEIPMDIKMLENMTVHEYLRNYCRVCQRRQAFYKISFNKFDRDKDGFLSIPETERALNDLYLGEIEWQQVKDLIALTTEENEAFDSKLFFALCALSERMFYSTFATDATSESYSKKQWLESADLSAIEWKFEGCNINRPLRKLFQLLVHRHEIKREDV